MRTTQLAAGLLFIFASLHVYGAQNFQPQLNENGLMNADQIEEQLANETQISPEQMEQQQAEDQQNPDLFPGHGGHGPGGGHGGGPHPHPGPGPRPPIPIPIPVPGPRYVTCYAQDARRIVYQATGYYPRSVQNAAMNECLQRSPWGSCVEMGCR